MRKTLAILAATTALTAAVALPAWSTLRNPSDIQPRASATDSTIAPAPMILASADDDEGEEDEDEDDEDDCDGKTTCHSGTNPAPAGVKPPPQNGLFGNGAPPKVQLN